MTTYTYTHPNHPGERAASEISYLYLDAAKLLYWPGLQPQNACLGFGSLFRLQSSLSCSVH